MIPSRGGCNGRPVLRKPQEIARIRGFVTQIIAQYSFRNGRWKRLTFPGDRGFGSFSNYRALRHLKRLQILPLCPVCGRTAGYTLSEGLSKTTGAAVAMIRFRLEILIEEVKMTPIMAP